MPGQREGARLFLFQAEDGIRYLTVTRVQTCALPISYLLVISDAANVESIRARVERAQTLYRNDLDQNRQGVIASIDVLRAQVELQTEQQRLISEIGRASCRERV